MTTVGELCVIYQRMVAANRNLKPSTREYYAECLEMGFRIWPELNGMDVAAIKPIQMVEWSGRLKFSESRYNGMVNQFRAMFALAIELEIRSDNPMVKVKPVPQRIRPPKLPSSEQFRQILDRLKTAPKCREAYRFVKFLACSGMRIGEARRLTREDITEHGIRIEEQKNGETSYVPLVPELRELLKELPESGPLFKIKSPRKALDTSCRLFGIPHISNHKLRHLFATHAIECGVDIKTVAAWLRHKDGGALALKRYSHVRNEHSVEMAAKVKRF